MHAAPWQQGAGRRDGFGLNDRSISFPKGAMVSYSHMFYGVDLNRLRSLFGSRDMALYEEIAGASDSLEDEEQDALKRIIMGNCRREPNTEHHYGYALKAICEHIGESIGAGDVAAVRDHPYKSKLVGSGPPVDIPYNPADFPEIGYLDRIDLKSEYKLATESKPKAKKTLVGFVLRKLSGGIVGREPDASEIAEDMAAYAETLKACIDRNCELVSFRH